MNKNLIIEHNNRNIFIVQVFIGAGSVFESKGEHGLSHLLEHMMFKSKKKTTVEQLLIELNSLGGVFNAMTSKDYTSYYIRTVETNWEKSMKLLRKIVFEPCFKKEDLKSEKRVVTEEFLQYEDDVKDILLETAFKLFLPSQNPYRKSIKGKILDINKTRAKTLLNYYNDRYKHSMIYINCNKEIDKSVRRRALKYFKQYLGEITFESDMCSLFKQIGEPIVRVISRPNRAQNATVIMFKGLPNNDKRNIDLELLWDILTGSLNSLLMLEMREKRGLVYGISSFNDTFMCMGVTGVLFTSSNKDIATVVKHVLNVLKKITGKGIKKTILDYSKASYINKLRYRLTEVEFAAERSMLRHYYKCPWDEDAVIKRLQRIKNENIISLCQEIFNFNQMCIVSIGRYDDHKSIEQTIKEII